MNVAVLHPGRMGAAVGRQAVGGGARVGWCTDGRSASSADRAAAAGMEPHGDLAELLSASDVIISLCPPAAAEEVAAQVAATGFNGIFVEANAISPQRSTRITEALVVAGAQVVDGCVIGPPPPAEVGTRLYLSGPRMNAEIVAALFNGTAVESVIIDGPPGDASALKMAFGGYQKASHALAAVSHALAEAHGVDGQLTTEARRLARSALADPGGLPSVAARAWRWAPEMREVAESLSAAKLPSDLALAAATVMELWSTDKDDFAITAQEVLAHLRTEGDRS